MAPQTWTTWDLAVLGGGERIPDIQSMWISQQTADQIKMDVGWRSSIGEHWLHGPQSASLPLDLNCQIHPETLRTPRWGAGFWGRGADKDCDLHALLAPLNALVPKHGQTGAVKTSHLRGRRTRHAAYQRGGSLPHIIAQQKQQAALTRILTPRFGRSLTDMTKLVCLKSLTDFSSGNVSAKKSSVAARNHKKIWGEMGKMFPCVFILQRSRCAWILF